MEYLLDHMNLFKDGILFPTKTIDYSLLDGKLEKIISSFL